MKRRLQVFGTSLLFFLALLAAPLLFPALPIYAQSATLYPSFFPGCGATGCAFLGPILLPDGTSSAPGLAFSNDPDVGIFRSGTNELKITTPGNFGVFIAAADKYWFTSAAFYPSTSDANTVGKSDKQWSDVYASRSLQGSKTKSLTDAGAAVSFVRIAVPTGGNIGGDVIYTATSTNGTAALTRQARWSFAGADTAGTVTCGVSAEYAVATAYSRANTLLCTMTAVTSTTNCDLQITCTDNLAAAQTVVFNWRLDMPLTATATPQ